MHNNWYNKFEKLNYWIQITKLQSLNFSGYLICNGIICTAGSAYVGRNKAGSNYAGCFYAG